MAKPGIGNIRSAGTFVTSYQWNVVFESFPELSRVGAYPDSDSVNVRCESSTIPKASNTKLTATIRGHKVHSPGTLEYNSPIELTFYETPDNTIQSFITAWREACYESESGVGADDEDVKCSIRLERLNKKDEVIWTYKLKGCFLEDYTTPDLGAEGEHWKPAMSVSFDNFIDEPA